MVVTDQPAAGAADASSSSQRRRRSRDNDISRLSRSGNSLYELLDIPKASTDNEIKKKYRRLALKYHPDKNPDNAEAEEMFKKINHANSILSDEKKRKLYDDYGSFGLYLADQIGEDLVGSVMFFQSKWIQSLICLCGIFTGCYFCCCLFCCCCCCCGKCKPKMEEEEDMPDVGDLADDEEEEEKDEPVTSQPQSSTSNPSPSSPTTEQDKTGQQSEKSPLNADGPAGAPPSYDSVFPNPNANGNPV